MAHARLSQRSTDLSHPTLERTIMKNSSPLLGQRQTPAPAARQWALVLAVLTTSLAATAHAQTWG
jgi:hypothetical protein